MSTFQVLLRAVPIAFVLLVASSCAISADDIPACQRVSYDFAADAVGSPSPREAIAQWNRGLSADPTNEVPQVPVSGWVDEGTTADGLRVLVSSTAPTWRIEAMQAPEGGWLVGTASFGACDPV